MAKFNQLAPRPKVAQLEEWREPDIQNAEDAEAYQYSDKLNLLTRAMTSMMGEDKFYESGETSDSELIKAFNKILAEDPEYAKGLFLSLRGEFHLRSVSHVLVAELARARTSETADLIAEICERPDDMTEILAYYTAKYGEAKLPNSLKKGLGRAFAKFNEYQLSKYDRKGKVWLRDILRIAHPKPRDKKQAALWQKVVADELPSADTWENKISNEGSNTENWAELVLQDKMGYMALLRNLRNLLKQDVPMAVIDKACAILSDPKRVEKSKQLPFRFFSAYKMLKQANDEHRPSPARYSYWGGVEDDQSTDDSNIHSINQCKIEKVFDALEEATRLASANIPKLEGDSVIACDVSGSMQEPISKKSSVERFDIGLIMGAMLNGQSQGSTTGIFGDTWKEIEIDGNRPLSSTWEMHRREGEVGYSTNGYKVIKALLEERRKVDRVLFFTDCQLYGQDTDIHQRSSNWLHSNQPNLAPGRGRNIGDLIKQYRAEINDKLKVYFFDLSGYGNCVVPEEDPQTMIVGGWSEKLFDIIPTFEEGGEGENGLDKRIRARYQAFQARKQARKALAKVA